MEVRFVMDHHPRTVHCEELGEAAEWLCATHPEDVVCVTESDGRLVGVLPGFARPQTAGSTQPGTEMIPRQALPDVGPTTEVAEVERWFSAHPEWPALPVVEGERLVGVIRRPTLRLRPTPVDPAAPPPPLDLLTRHVIETMMSGALVVDSQGIVRLLNPAGAAILGVSADRVVGRPYEELAQWIFPHMLDYLRISAIPQVLRGRTVEGERRVRLLNGRHALFRYAALHEGERFLGVIVTFMDVTDYVHAEAKAQAEAEEVEKAFGLTLPNSKVESKLKSSPEYQDIYDPDTGRATVTQVIPDGTYRHVINGLRILAELHAVGLFQLVGMDKDTMVQAFIFHDVGKEQPVLRVGQQFVPHDTFEPSHLHAYRSADWARKYYRVSEDVEWIIRYHHTPEAKLPPDFPPPLLPMLRVFQVVDGLSAGITRRKARIAPLCLDGTQLLIREDNMDRRYHRHYRLAIYSGTVTDLPAQEEGALDPGEANPAERVSM
ncbi:MAG: PAS domain-containing protein [Firmicutes bacterium]|nr:PAS domain-containing protein [Bacillota bacterium]